MSRIPLKTPSRSSSSTTTQSQPNKSIIADGTNVSVRVDYREHPSAASTRPSQSFRTPARPVRSQRPTATPNVPPPANTLGRSNPVPPRTPRSHSTTTNTNNDNQTVKRPTTARKVSNTQPPVLRQTKSSSGLKEHIARARAELQKSVRKTAPPIHDLAQSLDSSTLNDDPFSAIKDPFNQSKYRPKVVPEVEKAIKRAREDGRLHIPNLQLTELPQAVYKMYRADPSHVIDFSLDFNSSVYDYEDLTSFNAADNEISLIQDDFAEIFPGLCTLDLHNNRFQTLTESFIHLSQLSTLNVAGNELDEDALNMICQIETLVNLNFSRNKLQGFLASKLSDLRDLNSLDLAENDIEGIDYALSGCTKLQTLNLSGNRLGKVTSPQLASNSGLVELDLSRNRISNTFFTQSASFPRLEILNLSHNSLTSLAGDIDVNLPSLATLLLLQNQIHKETTIDPVLHGSSVLTTLNLEGNPLVTLPVTLFNLQHLKHLDISDCRLSEIDSRIGLLPKLEVLRWEGNPARIRGGFGMTTDDVLKYLRGRITSS